MNADLIAALRNWPSEPVTADKLIAAAGLDPLADGAYMAVIAPLRKAGLIAFDGTQYVRVILEQEARDG